MLRARAISLLSRVFFRRSYSSSERATVDFLSRTHFFSGTESRLLVRLHPYLHKRRYRPQEVIFFRQDPALALYILHTGAVQAFFPQADTQEALQTLGPGDVFGYEALLPKKRRLFDAIAKEPTHLWVLSHADARALMAHNTRLASQLLDSAAQAFQHSLAHICQHYEEQVGFFQLKRAWKI